MSDIRLTLDDRALQKRLKFLAEKQVPFASSLAINDTLNDVKAHEVKELPKILDRPTPFTLRGIFTSRSNKRNLTGVVGYKDIQAEYLGRQEEGGESRSELPDKVIASAQKRNKYGNLARGSLKRLRNKKTTYFSRKRGGSRLLFERTRRGGLKLLIVIAKVAKYKKRLGHRQRAERLIVKKFPSNMIKRINQQLKSGR